MKQIIAIVKPFLVEKILDALRRAPLEAVSVAEVKGMGKQKSYLDRYADTEYAGTFLPKVEITVWVDDLRAEDVARKIVDVARTGRMGDGKILILPAQSYEAVVDMAIVIRARRQVNIRLAAFSVLAANRSFGSPMARRASHDAAIGRHPQACEQAPRSLHRLAGRSESRQACQPCLTRPCRSGRNTSASTRARRRTGKRRRF